MRSSLLPSGERSSPPPIPNLDEFGLPPQPPPSPQSQQQLEAQPQPTSSLLRRSGGINRGTRRDPQVGNRGVFMTIRSTVTLVSTAITLFGFSALVGMGRFGFSAFAGIGRFGTLVPSQKTRAEAIPSAADASAGRNSTQEANVPQKQFLMEESLPQASASASAAATTAMTVVAKTEILRNGDTKGDDMNKENSPEEKRGIGASKSSSASSRKELSLAKEDGGRRYIRPQDLLADPSLTHEDISVQHGGNHDSSGGDMGSSTSSASGSATKRIKREPYLKQVVPERRFVELGDLLADPALEHEDINRRFLRAESTVSGKEGREDRGTKTEISAAAAALSVAQNINVSTFKNKDEEHREDVRTASEPSPARKTLGLVPSEEVGWAGYMVTAAGVGRVWSPEIPTRPSEEAGVDLPLELTGERTSGERLFPSVAESTVMFLHVFKCAGSTLRRLLVEWAKADGGSGAIVSACDHVDKKGRVCLDHYKLLDVPVQEGYIADQKVLAGHFLWGFQHHVKTPRLMVTMLRNPLELFVSAQQYIHRKATKTVATAANHMREAMLYTLKTGGPGNNGDEWEEIRVYKEKKSGVRTDSPGQLTGYIRRFVGEDRRVLHGEALERATDAAIANLETFWLVGVVENYTGFMEVFKRMLDPEALHKELWWNYSFVNQYNISPVKSTAVLGALDPYLVSRFNESLALQWSLYEKATSLFTERCVEVLAHKKKDSSNKFCTVPRAPAQYRRLA